MLFCSIGYASNLLRLQPYLRAHAHPAERDHVIRFEPDTDFFAYGVIMVAGDQG